MTNAWMMMVAQPNHMLEHENWGKTLNWQAYAPEN